jgi:hypothetical protein
MPRSTLLPVLHHLAKTPLCALAHFEGVARRRRVLLHHWVFWKPGDSTFDRRRPFGCAAIISPAETATVRRMSLFGKFLRQGGENINKHA